MNEVSGLCELEKVGVTIDKERGREGGKRERERRRERRSERE